MKKTSFLKQTMVIGGGAIISMIIGLFTTPMITRLISPEDYGQLSIFNMYSNIVMMLVGFGLDQSFVRYYYNEENDEYKKRLLTVCCMYPIIAIIVCCAVLSSFFLLVNCWNEKMTRMIMVYAFNVIVLLLNRYSCLVLRMEKRSKLYSSINIIHKVLYVLFVMVIIKVIRHNDFKVLVFSTILSMMIPTFVAIIAELKKWSPTISKYKKKIDIRGIVKYGVPFLASNGIYLLFQAIDKISLQYYCSYEDVGVYASATSLLSIISIIRTSFTTVWVPISIEHYEKNPQDKMFYQRINKYITVVMFVFGISLILAKDLIVLLLGEKFRGAAGILPFLLFQPIMYTISETTVVGVYFSKKSVSQLLISIIVCCANIVGNCTLIPLLGCKGAAISTGASYILFFILRTCFSNKYYYIDYGLKKFFVISVLAVIYAIYNTFYKFNIVNVLGYIVILTVLCVLYRIEVIELVDILKNNILKIKKRG